MIWAILAEPAGVAFAAIILCTVLAVLWWRSGLAGIDEIMTALADAALSMLMGGLIMAAIIVLGYGILVLMLHG